MKIVGMNMNGGKGIGWRDYGVHDVQRYGVSYNMIITVLWINRWHKMLNLYVIKKVCKMNLNSESD